MKRVRKGSERVPAASSAFCDCVSRAHYNLSTAATYVVLVSHVCGCRSTGRKTSRWRGWCSSDGVEGVVNAVELSWARLTKRAGGRCAVRENSLAEWSDFERYDECAGLSEQYLASMF